MLPAIGRTSPRALPECHLGLDAAGLPRGKEPEDDRGHGGDQEREDQAGGFEADRLDAADGQRARGQRHQGEHAPVGEDEPGGAAQRREHEAFDDQLPDQTAAAGAE